jgi:hypothetical protein
LREYAAGRLRPLACAYGTVWYRPAGHTSAVIAATHPELPPRQGGQQCDAPLAMRSVLTCKPA